MKGSERSSQYCNTAIGNHDNACDPSSNWLGVIYPHPPTLLFQFMTAGVSVAALLSSRKEQQLVRVVLWTNSTQVKRYLEEEMGLNSIPLTLD